jgi:hypothetical protein
MLTIPKRRGQVIGDSCIKKKLKGSAMFVFLLQVCTKRVSVHFRITRHIYQQFWRESRNDEKYLKDRFYLVCKAAAHVVMSFRKQLDSKMIFSPFFFLFSRVFSIFPSNGHSHETNNIFAIVDVHGVSISWHCHNKNCSGCKPWNQPLPMKIALALILK